MTVPMLTIRPSQHAVLNSAAIKTAAAPPPPPTESGSQAVPIELPPTDRMLTIRAEQLREFQAVSLKKFLVNTFSYVMETRPEWCKARSTEEIQRLICQLTDLGRAHGILRGRNLRKFIMCKIDHDFPVDLSAYRRGLLGKSGLDEDYRINSFLEAVSSRHELIPIKLDTVLDAGPGR